MEGRLGFCQFLCKKMTFFSKIYRETPVLILRQKNGHQEGASQGQWKKGPPYGKNRVTNKKSGQKKTSAFGGRTKKRPPKKEGSSLKRKKRRARPPSSNSICKRLPFLLSKSPAHLCCNPLSTGYVSVSYFGTMKLKHVLATVFGALKQLGLTLTQSHT